MAFVLGLHRDPGLNDLIAEENALHDDIIQGDFADSYQNMTLKSLLGLKIVDERCPGVRYLLKTDDDMIVKLPYLLDLLDHTHANLSRSIMGPLNIGSRVYRHGKWKLTRSEFPFDHFPPYESGSAYVITGDLVHELFVTAEFVPYISIDDVYVTGILGRILGVKHVRQRGFAFWTDKPPTDCDLVLNRVVTGTKMTPPNLLNIWKRLKQNLKCSVCTPFYVSQNLTAIITHIGEIRGKKFCSRVLQEHLSLIGCMVGQHNIILVMKKLEEQLQQTLTIYKLVKNEKVTGFCEYSLTVAGVLVIRLNS